jgi:hypothetical protein
MDHKQVTGIEVTQVKRHRKKPRVEVPLTRVRRMLREANIKAEEGHAYILYKCGHVHDAREDPSIITYFAGTHRGLRSCPVCVSAALLTKYKKCGCGAEHIGKRVQPSKCCSACRSSRRVAKGETPKIEKIANSHLADPSRCFCIHRMECLTKYEDYDTVPCKRCKRFKEGEWVTD